MKKTPPISLTGCLRGEAHHVCAFFDADEEEYRVLLPFIEDRFECGNNAVHVVNPDRRDDHLQWQAGAGFLDEARERPTGCATPPSTAC